MIVLQLLLIGIVCTGFAMGKCDVLLILWNNYTPRVGGLVPFHRYVKKTNAYNLFYTTHTSEINATIVGDIGAYDYVYKGVVFFVYDASDTGRPSATVPLHRYYNARADRHFYTIDVTEIGTTVVGETKKSYTYEGIAAYIFPASSTPATALYRYYNAAHDSHLYTIDPTEIDTLTVGEVGNLDYKYEGIAGYVYSTEKYSGE